MDFTFLSKLAPLYRRAALLAFAAALLAGSWFRVFDVYEFQTYDWRYRLKPAPPVSKDIVLIEIWDDSLQKIGSWPFRRQYYALLAEIMKETGAKMLGFDILFVEPGPDDEAFAAALRSYPNAYFSHVFESPALKNGRIESPAFQARLLDSFAALARGVGHVNAVADADGKRRRVPPVIYHDDKAWPHLGLLMAGDYLGVPRDQIWADRKSIRIGDRVRVPLDEEGCILVHFAGTWTRAFQHVSFVDLLATYAQIRSGSRPASELAWLKDKVCFLGLTATGTHDINPIPLEPSYPQMGVHANVFNSILSGQFIIRAPKPANLAALIVLAFIAAGLTRLPGLAWSIVSAAAGLGFFTAAAMALFIFRLVWIDIFYPSIAFGVIYLGGIVLRTMGEKRKRELLESELAIASEIQKSFLPSALPESDALDIAVFMKPAKHVGGDLYAIFKPAADRIGVMLGDVSGKGVPAALFMAKSVSEFKFNSLGSSDPAGVLTKLNESLAAEPSSGLFVTMSYAVFGLSDRSMALSSGGHLPVLWVKRAGGAEWLSPEGGMPLSLASGIEFTDLVPKISPGDVLVFYSDGISEARNGALQDYETDRLAEAVSKNRQKTASEIQACILDDVRRFVGRAPQHDDMTLIVVKIRG